ncbi:MAG: hypothetical protein ACKVSF_07190 [Alphaproteobacteria bacterium]
MAAAGEVEMRDAGNRKVKGFRVSTVVVTGFVIKGETAHLAGRLDGPDGECRFDGLIFVEPEHVQPTPIRSFPAGPAPDGWSVRAIADQAGYEMVHDETGEVILAFRIRDEICEITTNIYDADGPLALAQDGDLIMSGGTITFSEEVGTRE